MQRSKSSLCTQGPLCVRPGHPPLAGRGMCGTECAQAAYRPVLPPACGHAPQVGVAAAVNGNALSSLALVSMDGIVTIMSLPGAPAARCRPAPCGQIRAGRQSSVCGTPAPGHDHLEEPPPTRGALPSVSGCHMCCHMSTGRQPLTHSHTPCRVRLRRLQRQADQQPGSQAGQHCNSVKHGELGG